MTPPTTATAVRAGLAGAVALAVAMGIGRFAFTPMLPVMQDAGLTLVEAGWLASANYLGYFAGALGAGALRWSTVRIVAVGLAGIAAVTFGMGVTDDLAWWLVLRFLAGVLSACVLVHASAWALARKASAGVVFAGVGGGSAAAGLVCLGVLANDIAAPAAWMLLGALALVLCALALPVITSGAGASDGPREPHRWDALALRLVVCYGIYGFGYILPATFLPAMARQAVADPSVFGWTWPVFGVVAMFSTLIAGRLRAASSTVWAASHVIMAAGIALPLVVPGIAAIIVSAVAVGGTFIVVTMAAIQLVRRLMPRSATSLFGAMTAAFAAGQVLGPLTVTARYGIEAPLVVAAVLLVATAVPLFSLRTLEVSDEAVPQQDIAVGAPGARHRP